MGNSVWTAMLDALCCCRAQQGNKAHSSQWRQNRVLSSLCPCCLRKSRDSPGEGFRDNYGDMHCPYNDDYTIDTVCIQGQAMILPPNESTIEPFIADLGGSGSGPEADSRDGGGGVRGSLGGNVIYKQPLNVGLLQYNPNQDPYLDIR